MAKKYFEDFAVGYEVETGKVKVTLEMIKDFARQYDPQDIHLDEEKAKDSILGRLVGSAWQTAALTIKLMVEAKPLGDTPVIGLEVNDFKIPAPMLPGDTIQVRAKITKVWRSKTKPYGFFHMSSETVNQNGEVILSQTWTVIVPTRN